MGTLSQTLLFDSYHKDQMAKYQRLWSFYVGEHWTWDRGDDAPLSTFNYARLLVNKHMQFLVGKGFTIHTEPENKEQREFLNKVWDENEREMLGLEMALNGGITGDIWLYPGYDEETDQLTIGVLPSHTVFPIFKDRQRRKMAAVMIQWVESRVKNLSPDKLEMENITVGEFITPDTITYLEDGEPTGSKPNVFGEIFLVHAPNVLVAQDFFGLSDIEDAIPLNKVYNEKATDMADILDYHAAPVTIVAGAKISNLQKGADRLWGGLPKDGKVYNLEMGGDLGASRGFLDTIKESMMEVGNLPEHALGRSGGISNTSAAALGMMYLPQLQYMLVKRMCFGLAVRRVNRFLLKMGVALGKVKANESMFSPRFTEVHFPEPLPRDRRLQIEEIEALHTLRLTTRRDMLRELGSADPDKDLLRIDKDLEKDDAAANARFFSGRKDDDDDDRTQPPGPVKILSIGPASPGTGERESERRQRAARP